MQLNQLHRPKNLKRGKQRVGRGQSSGRGKQSGRGGKGQTARAGAKIRPEWRDIIKRLPKRRGFGKNRGRTVVGTRPDALALSVGRLEKLFESGATVSSATLSERGVGGRKFRSVKIVGPSNSLGASGFTKKLTIKGIAVSTSARAAIEKAGGSIM
ncbi:50S ribosomal protein L15 [Candidatus Kaiserbacteria bacterium]|nr:50S ribosomal protein L15 [Candidatus Kaiserbacteria bacterium]